MRNKNILLFFLIFGFILNNYSQDYNSDKTSLINFLKRMYHNNSSNGVKIVEDYENNYLISVVLLEKVKYTNLSTINRVAQVKAQSQANAFINGTTIENELIITTTESRSDNAKEITTESVEKIKEKGYGFVNGLELLTSFDSNENQGVTIFIFIKKID